MYNRFQDKYERALEAVKKLQEANPTDQRIGTWVAEYFPELKESEDERIKKKVISILRHNIDGAESQMQASRGVDRTFEIYACNKVIAWLEKQKAETC